MTVIGGCRKCILTFPDERSLLRHIRLHCPDLFYLTSDCVSTSPLNAAFKDTSGMILSDSNRLTPFAEETSMIANDGDVVKTEAPDPDDLEFSHVSESVFHDQLLVRAGGIDSNVRGYLGVSSSSIIKPDPQSSFVLAESCSDGRASPGPAPRLDDDPTPNQEFSNDQNGRIGSVCGSGSDGVIADSCDVPGSPAPAPPSMVSAVSESSTGFACYECGTHFQSAERYDRHLAFHLKRNGARKDIPCELGSCEDSVTSTSAGLPVQKSTVSPDSSGVVDENVDSEHLGHSTSALGEHSNVSPAVPSAPSTSAYTVGDGCRPRYKRSAAASDKPKLLPSCRTSNPYLEDLLDSALQPKSSTNPALGRYHNKQRMLGVNGKSKDGDHEKIFQFGRPKKSGFSRFPRIVDDCPIEGPSDLNQKRAVGDANHITSIPPALARSPLVFSCQPDGVDDFPNYKSKHIKLTKFSDCDPDGRPETAEIDSPPLPVFGGDRINEFDQIDQFRAHVKMEIVDHEPEFGVNDNSFDQIFKSGSIFDSFNAHSGMQNSIVNQIIQNSTEIFGNTFPPAPVSTDCSTGVDGSRIDKSATSFDAFLRGFSSYFPSENAQSSASERSNQSPPLATATSGMSSQLTPDAVTAFLSRLYEGSLPPFSQFPPKTLGSQQLSNKKCSSNCDVAPGSSDMLGRIPTNSKKPQTTSAQSSISTSPPLMFNVTCDHSPDDAATAAVVAPADAAHLLSGSTSSSCCLRTSSGQNEYLENIFRNNVYPHPRTRRRTVNGEQMQG